VSLEMKIYLVEDHPIFRRGLSDLIENEADLTVTGGAEDIGTAWKEIQEDIPDVILVDISLKGRNGLELVKMICDWKPELPILVISTHEENLYAERSLRAGARGYIMKHEAAEKVIEGIRQVAPGGVYLSSRMASTILAKSVGHAKANTISPEESLSDRELQVFELFGTGLGTKEISVSLNLSAKTIGTYRERIKEKLSLKNSSELLRRAVNWVERTRIN
jgi:DNA-binding NarL/FixJ family response regulator